MKRKVLSKSEIKELDATLSQYGITLSKKDQLILENSVYKKNGELLAVVIDEQVYPSVKNQQIHAPAITVDMGAIKFVLKGADIMRPGVVACDTFEKNEVVIIKDEKFNKVLAIGVALFSSEELLQQKSGKVFLNKHYYNDDYFSQ